MKEFFVNLFEYSYKYNMVIADVIQNSNNKISSRAESLFSHILNSHHIWNSRINHNATEMKVWGILDNNLLNIVINENYNKTLDIISSKDLNEINKYQNSKGQEFSNSIQDILFHIVNHTTHHRAQIVTELRLSGIEPPITDYIFYKR